ncbi:unnamed protein product [Cylicocyclus nassatus]|uniref:Potassium channel tetramerisation-type BTB domain-containing protein n=1 Tax=Cylicocyclus nassatus TaxID=53992 RepID=A0AA36HF99_CYLNA|nr:unnamed protein product [Cylicocyclus nassatus]
MIEMKEESIKYKPEDIIRLNVGGQRFDTYLGTLLVDRTNEIYPQFIALLEPDAADPPPPKDSEGAFFLDRDPDGFRLLLSGLRYLAQCQPPQSQNGTIKNSNSEEDLRTGKETKGIWHRIRSSLVSGAFSAVSAKDCAIEVPSTAGLKGAFMEVPHTSGCVFKQQSELDEENFLFDTAALAIAAGNPLAGGCTSKT